MSTFKQEQWLFGEMGRELQIIAQRNAAMQAAHKYTEILVFAEASLVMLAFEHFLRVLLKDEAQDHHTLPPLLKMALEPDRGLLDPPTGMSIVDTVKLVKEFRNSLMHGNIQQASTRAGCATVLEYLAGPFGTETKQVFDILSALLGQIDPETGRRRT